MSILEGMFYGCPSVSTRVGGIPEVIRSDSTGLLVAPGGYAESFGFSRSANSLPISSASEGWRWVKRASTLPKATSQPTSSFRRTKGFIIVKQKNLDR